jgi:hypothetical protein
MSRRHQRIKAHKKALYAGVNDALSIDGPGHGHAKQVTS